MVLYAFNSGRSSDVHTSIAEEISATFQNLTVYAPTRTVTISSTRGFLGLDALEPSSDGTHSSNSGYWLAYQKGVAVATYDGDWTPGSSTRGHAVDLSSISNDHFEGDIGKRNSMKYLLLILASLSCTSC